jgi:serine protease
MDHGADVINLSIAQESGGDNSILLLRSPSVNQAIRGAAARGAVVVIAAGNDPSGAQSQTSYDATTPGVVVVGASTKGDKPAAYSNYGVGLDLLAPGGGSSSDPSADACSETNSIVSTWWDPSAKHSTYGGGCGTSMAVAFVSGVAAMLRAHGFSNAQAVSRILNTADDIGAAGRDNRTGYGILNAARALAASASRPAPRATISSAPKPPATHRVITAGAPAAPKKARPKPKAARAPVRDLTDAPAVAVAPVELPSTKEGWSYSLAAGLIVIVALMHASLRLAMRKPR